MKIRPTVSLFVALVVAALLSLACSILGAERLMTPSARVSINFSRADVDRAEALWKSKALSSYQIEVWNGGITPPPPVYVVQVWRNQVVYGRSEHRIADSFKREGQAFAVDDPRIQAVTVPGLFLQARKLLTMGSQPAQIETNISAKFDPEWGYPSLMSTSSKCPDCVWSSQVEKFVPLDSTAPPAAPTPRPTATPYRTATPRP